MAKEPEMQLGHNDYEVIKRDVMYEGVFRLVRLTLRYRLYNGKWSAVFTREVLERLSAAAILPYDPLLDRVILIEQFRPGTLADPQSPWTIEIPSGVLDRDEAPHELAIREAQEEAGCNVSQLELIQAYFVSPGGCDEFVHVYCGRIDASDVGGIHGLENEHENIRVLNLTVEEALQKLHRNEIKTSPAIIALQWLELNRERLRKQWKARHITNTK